MKIYGSTTRNEQVPLSHIVKEKKCNKFPVFTHIVILSELILMQWDFNNTIIIMFIVLDVNQKFDEFSQIKKKLH